MALCTQTVTRTGPLLAGLFLAGSVWAEEISSDDLAQLPEADVVIIGEIHDNPVHHENQGLVAAALSPTALVFEMIEPDVALVATPENRRNPQVLAEALGWQDSGWPDFAFYYPIFVAAPEAAVFGGAVPRQTAREAVREGAAAVIGGSAALFGLDRALDPDEQATRNALQGEAHCGALPEDILPGMVEAQRLRDAALARAIVAAFAEAGGPVLVITGNGHARRDWGIPRMLERVDPDLRVLSVGQFESVPDDDAPFDKWLVTPPAERGDPCAAFQ